MKVYYRKKYVYIDASILQGDEASEFLMRLAQDKMAVYVYVRDAGEAVLCEKQSWYTYVCDTVTGDSMMKAVLSSSTVNNQKHPDICVIGTGEMFTKEHGLDICYIGMPGVESLIDIQIKRTGEHGLAWAVVNAVMMGSLFYFIIFMTFMDKFPSSMSDGFAGTVSMLLPLILMVGTMVYAVKKRVYTRDKLLDILNIWV